MKIALCLPCHSSECKIWFAISLMQTKWPKDAIVNLFCSTGSRCENAWTDLTKEALMWGADFLVIIANDIAWKPEDIKRLVDHNLPIVGGWACARKAPFRCFVVDKYNPETKMFSPVQNCKERKGLEKVVSVGGELIVMRRDIFDIIPRPWYFGPEMVEPANEHMMTSDYYFALQCIKHGIDYYVDWGVPLIHATDGMITHKGNLISR